MKALGSAATIVAGFIVTAGLSGAAWAERVGDRAQPDAEPATRLAMAIIPKAGAGEDFGPAGKAENAAAAVGNTTGAEAETGVAEFDFATDPDDEPVLRPGHHVETAAAAPGDGLPAGPEATPPVAEIPVEAVWTPSITDPDSPVPVAKPAEIAALTPAEPVIQVLARVDLSEQRLYLYVEDRLVHTWPVSTGRRGYGTPTGQWNAQWLSRWHRSRKYNNAPMPFAVFFHSGYAIHATTDTRRLGRIASHGCVRLHPENAEIFFKLVQSYGMRSTLVSVVR
jgi:lipoprotein-anchoring transpeptidase ErfK/SrfK